ncbi:uncharacterized protein AMSG_07832 [Thecamonas trahens ATCC 50062]|uniref:SAP domain-containing protein n=1 Tax=Thecamonas trahens ATCC 50062 TaxID=461836 RepID=A0A0L0DHC0_THETB|nr:hypothetical protein AMSG_07832 [Thecamonas trahens ATCC 50062]KNC51759.1 hypothetical protein AMSG_07832 [Thecamonas trahens ATCC 50062]|eukprot:XP_013755886.1 hypothetical protein AMSG_07832 [Thecamonas trahens ATCC 50062]
MASEPNVTRKAETEPVAREAECGPADDLALIEAQVEPPRACTGPNISRNLMAMKKTELVDMAKKLGVSSRGTKAQIVVRIAGAGEVVPDMMPPAKPLQAELAPHVINFAPFRSFAAVHAEVAQQSTKAIRAWLKEAGVPGRSKMSAAEARRCCAWIQYRSSWPSMLIELPDELLLLILHYLEVPNLVNILMTCRRLYAIGRDNLLWRAHADAVFETLSSNTLVSSLDCRTPGVVYQAILDAAARRCPVCLCAVGKVRGADWGPDPICNDCIMFYVNSSAGRRDKISYSRATIQLGLRSADLVGIAAERRVNSFGMPIRLFDGKEIIKAVTAKYGSVAAGIQAANPRRASSISLPRKRRRTAMKILRNYCLPRLPLWAFDDRFSPGPLAIAGDPSPPPPPPNPLEIVLNNPKTAVVLPSVRGKVEAYVAGSLPRGQFSRAVKDITSSYILPILTRGIRAVLAAPPHSLSEAGIDELLANPTLARNLFAAAEELIRRKERMAPSK